MLIETNKNGVFTQDGQLCKKHGSNVYTLPKNVEEIACELVSVFNKHNIGKTLGQVILSAIDVNAFTATSSTSSSNLKLMFDWAYKVEHLIPKHVYKACRDLNSEDAQIVLQALGVKMSISELKEGYEKWLNEPDPEPEQETEETKTEETEVK